MVRVKICGIKDAETALLCAEEGADFIGFVFAESPRKIEPERAREIVLSVRERFPRKPLFVGVFANQSLPEITEAVEISGVDMVQLSGEEPPSFLRPIPKPKIKAVGPDTDEDKIRAYIREGAIILLDRKEGARYGGTGKTIDWEKASKVASKFPIILAGGLSPENVREAIRLVKPWGVDVSGGVEREGRKDPERIRAFIRGVRDEVR